MMAWSTSQLAEFAGTTVKAIRHYHRLGLLDEPERASNGYKHYTTPHLVRLLKIRRLRDLGIALSEISAMEESDEGSEASIRARDAEISATIDRLQGVRAELADILRHQASADGPAGFSAVAHRLSASDQALIMISSRVFTDDVIDDMRSIVTTEYPIDAEFDALPADADEATILDLARRLAPVIRDIRADHLSTEDLSTYALRGEKHARTTIVQAMAELYNPAQLAVLEQANRIVSGT